MIFYKAFTVTGVANQTELDSGLVSLLEEKKKIRAVLINSSAHEGNVIEGWIGTNRVLECHDYLFDTQEETAGATAPLSQNKISRIPLDKEIPAGQIFKIGINCGATLSTIYGAYEYEILP